MRFPRITFFILLVNIIPVKSTNYYWVGGSGNWSDYAAHWATASGGLVFHTQVPTSNDNVYFDINSFSAGGDTLFVDQTIVYCKDMDWTGVINNPTLGGEFNNFLKIYGSFKLVPQMKYAFEGTISFEAGTSGKTITSNGKKFINHLYFNGSGGGWILQDSLSLDSVSIIYLNNGTLNTNGKTVRCGSFESSNSNVRALNLGTTKLFITPGPNNPTAWNTQITDNFTFSIGTSSVNIVGNSYYAAYIGNLSFYDLTLSFSSNYNYYTKECNVYGGKNFHALTSDIDDATIQTDSSVFIHKGIFNSNMNLNANCMFDSLILSPGKIYTLKSGTTQKINNSLIANGNCSGMITIQSDTSGIQANMQKSNGSVICSFVLLNDIKSFGGASFNAINSVDLGNNTGWTINAPAGRNLYWVGGEGDWEDANHWSTTSGGTGGNCLPNPTDNVYFDNNSFSADFQYINVNTSVIYFKNMNWTVSNYLNLFDFHLLSGSKTKIYGSLNLNSNLVGSFDNVYFESTAAGNIIKSGGQIGFNQIFFNGSGEWLLQDSLMANEIDFSNGTLRTNNNNIHCYYFSLYGPANHSLFLGSSKVYIGGSWNAYSSPAANLSLSTGTSSLIFNGSNYGYLYSSGLKLNYYNVIFNQNFLSGNSSFQLDASGNSFHNLKITGIGESSITCDSCSIHRADFEKGVAIKTNCTFDSLLLSAGSIYEIAGGSIQTINNMIQANGSCNKPITIKSSSSVQAMLKKQNGVLNSSYIILKGINASGGATFNANNAVNLGNNTGWNITSLSSRNLYWVGGTGYWSDPNHWSITSGGTGGACIPLPIDNVNFDNNSFNSNQDSVTVDPEITSCNDMNWTAVTGNPALLGESKNELNIYGSLKFIQNMEMNFQGEVFFTASDSGNTILCAGKNFHNNVIFDGNNGEWTLKDSLVIPDSLSCNIGLRAGTLNTNSKTIRCSSFYLEGNDNKTLNLDSSFIYLNNSWYPNSYNITLNAGASTIVFNANELNSAIYLEGDFEYNNVIMNNNGLDLYYSSIYKSKINNLITEGGGHTDLLDAITIKKAVLLNDVNFQADCSFDSLILTPGHTYNFSPGTTQTINKDIIAEGNGGFPIEILSSQSGSQAFLSKSNGVVCTDYLFLRDIKTQGGAIWFAGSHSSDISNNTGLIFASCDTTYNNVWPGDANADLVANNLDILSIGLAFNETGNVRPNASNNWTAQPSFYWNSQFADSTNTSHADCNGDGVINFDDTLAVNLNYGSTHNKKENALKANAGDPDLHFISIDTNHIAGSTINFELWSGDTTKIVKNIYGIAFDVSYNSSLVQAGTIKFSFPDSYIGNIGLNAIKLVKMDEPSRLIHAVIVKTDHKNSSGFGKIGSLKLTTDTNIHTLSSLLLQITNYNAIDSAETPLTFNTPVSTFTISPPSDPIIPPPAKIDTLKETKIYPNPSKGKFTIVTKPNTEIRVFNVIGKNIYKKVLNNMETEVDLSTMLSGVYVIKFYYQNNFIETRKIVIQ